MHTLVSYNNNLFRFWVFETYPFNRCFVSVEHAWSGEGVEGEGPGLAPAPHVRGATEEWFDKAGVDLDVGVELEVTEDLTTELGGFMGF
jgi:hypothetical protein